ncbi:MAG: ferredoxin-type protein NapH [Limisphaerales bacterium]|jgi:ferredoxin-type protein NapH
MAKQNHIPNKRVMQIGMLLFLAAFGYFLSLPFTAKYTITDTIAENHFGSRVALIKESSPDLINSEFSSKASILSALSKASKDGTVAAKVNIGISPENINSMVEAYAGKPFILEDVVKAYEAEGLSEKASKLREWFGWFDGQEIAETDLRAQLESKAAELNAGIVGLNLGADAKFSLLKEAAKTPAKSNAFIVFLLTFGLGTIGALMHILPKRVELPGIKNHRIWFDSLNSRGIIGIIVGTFLILFYIVIYWWPAWMTEWAALTDPIAYALTGSGAGQWFLYGMFYTFAVVVMGIRFLIKYRHSRYQQIRTFSVMFFQVAFAFIIANGLQLFHLPYADLKNIWPLDYSFFFDYRIDKMLSAGTIGYFMLGWGMFLVLIGVPLFTYFYGKRWYCSWICGCGGLAETAGDSFRQLSDKSLKAWKFERISIHSVLVIAVVMTILVSYTTWNEVAYGKQGAYLFGINSYDVRHWYWFGISAVFAGVVGTGFYPMMGNRVWCRFGCPLAAYLGFIQRFKSRFRITTNGGQCISCGNCSTYCEQGIDVRWYAQRGQNIVRSSCVGCGVCSSVCPRGVLNLENGPDSGRTEIQAIHIGRDEVKILS